MTRKDLPQDILDQIARGVVIPACPLALTSSRKFDERRQRALMRYYIDAGAGGVAVGMHFTQFEIRKPVSTFSSRFCAFARRRSTATAPKSGAPSSRSPASMASRVRAEAGGTRPRTRLPCFHHLDGGLRQRHEQELIHHIHELAKVMPLFGFYLLTGVGGIKLPYAFWRDLVEVENVVGIKIAPFDRLRHHRCRAGAGGFRPRKGRDTLHGNDDSIIYDFVTPYRFGPAETARTVRIRGGLLGQWGCWTKRAVELHERLLGIVDKGEPVTPELLTLSAQITDANAALFDPAHGYAGSIPGVNEVLRRQGLLEGIWTLKREEVLSPGQAEEIDRVYAAYPHLNDDEFVKANLDRWLA